MSDHDDVRETLLDNDTDQEISGRFRKFLPVIVDVETGGFNSQTDALLEIAAVTIEMDHKGRLVRGETIAFQVEPFEGANIEQSALDFTGICIEEAGRNAVEEDTALKETFKVIRDEIKAQACNRAILVGHNAHFDLGFVMAAAERNKIKRNPFHPFSCFDTATLSGLAYGQTVLAKACECAGLEFSNRSAHSAAYDAEKTADLFCTIVNRWQKLGGWPISY
jgi:ribonuclease T